MSNDDIVPDPGVMERLRRSLNRLPPRRRNIFLLVHAEGWTCAQIARLYGISVWRVRRHISIAMYVLLLEVMRGQPQSFWQRWRP